MLGGNCTQCCTPMPEPFSTCGGWCTHGWTVTGPGMTYADLEIEFPQPNPACGPNGTVPSPSWSTSKDWAKPASEQRYGGECLGWQDLVIPQGSGLPTKGQLGVSLGITPFQCTYAIHGQLWYPGGCEDDTKIHPPTHQHDARVGWVAGFHCFWVSRYYCDVVPGHDTVKPYISTWMSGAVTIYPVLNYCKSWTNIYPYTLNCFNPNSLFILSPLPGEITPANVLTRRFGYSEAYWDMPAEHRKQKLFLLSSATAVDPQKHCCGSYDHSTLITFVTGTHDVTPRLSRAGLSASCPSESSQLLANDCMDVLATTDIGNPSQGVYGIVYHPDNCWWADDWNTPTRKSASPRPPGGKVDDFFAHHGQPPTWSELINLVLTYQPTITFTARPNCIPDCACAVANADFVTCATGCPEDPDQRRPQDNKIFRLGARVMFYGKEFYIGRPQEYVDSTSMEVWKHSGGDIFEYHSYKHRSQFDRRNGSPFEEWEKRLTAEIACDLEGGEHTFVGVFNSTCRVYGAAEFPDEPMSFYPLLTTCVRRHAGTFDCVTVPQCTHTVDSPPFMRAGYQGCDPQMMDLPNGRVYQGTSNCSYQPIGEIQDLEVEILPGVPATPDGIMCSTDSIYDLPDSSCQPIIPIASDFTFYVLTCPQEHSYPIAWGEENCPDGSDGEL